jgi:hypothetical protein
VEGTFETVLWHLKHLNISIVQHEIIPTKNSIGRKFNLSSHLEKAQGKRKKSFVEFHLP